MSQWEKWGVNIKKINYEIHKDLIKLVTIAWKERGTKDKG